IFNNEITILNQIYNLMSKTTAELIYEHQKRALRLMLDKPKNKENTNNLLSEKYYIIKNDNLNNLGISIDINGCILNNGLSDKLFSILQHRKKSYCEEYCKVYLNTLVTKNNVDIKLESNSK